MNIPKSLHTVSAIVAVARYTQKDALARGSFYAAASCAAEILGYRTIDAIDVYGLIVRAADTLKKGAAA